MALLNGRGEAPPSHTWRGLAACRDLQAYTTAGPGPGRSMPAAGPGPGRSMPAARTPVTAGELTPGAGCPEAAGCGSDCGQSGGQPPFLGITRALAWTSPIAGKNPKLLAGNSCARSSGQSTNSFTAKAGVLPGGNSRNAGETRATGKPGNRDSSCCFHGRRSAAERQGSRATGSRGATWSGEAPPTHTWRGLILVCAAWCQVLTPLSHPLTPPRSGRAGPGALTSGSVRPDRPPHCSRSHEPHWPLPPTFPAERAPKPDRAPATAPSSPLPGTPGP